ncbi:hypothetical protein E2C01_049526 [Portunus trituberculatus]|uniref:Uncharacterized protein n=1 Tax=Portunus trituberculatus TaxID=210409 RepID=A0A5B7GGA2_PORTR|nr:hypothetical protein [Portunus trituberculatus]
MLCDTGGRGCRAFPDIPVRSSSLPSPRLSGPANRAVSLRQEASHPGHLHRDVRACTPLTPPSCIPPAEGAESPASSPGIFGLPAAINSPCLEEV